MRRCVLRVDNWGCEKVGVWERDFVIVSLRVDNGGCEKGKLGWRTEDCGAS